MKGLLASAIAALVAAVSAADTSRLTPPVLPLAVRNPYLSTWLPTAREAPWNHWPMFWTGEELGFSVMALVPDSEKVYPLLGRPHDSLSANSDDGYNVSFPTFLGAKYDASTTNLTYELPAPDANSSADPALITLSFLSPITPTSTLRQGIPAAYIAVHVHASFDLDVYVDVNGQWVSGDRGANITWAFEERSLKDGKGLKSHSFKRETEQLFTEFADRSEWGTLYLTAPSVGTSAWVRKRFARYGKLNNDVDTTFRTIMDDEPIFAFSNSFSLSADKKTDSVLFTLAHIQDPVVQFASARGLTAMRPLWSSFFDDVAELLTFHYYDFEHAFVLADAYSSQLQRDALASGAEDYADIVALSARQVLGATSFSGTPSDPLLFLKEISSNGNFQTIDVIFPSFPFFLYTNPRWLAYLLEPLLEHMLSGQYPNDYAMHDLGTHFPNATGHPDGADEYMPVEECGNILLMGQALVNSLLYDTAPAAGSPFVATGVESRDYEAVAADGPGSVFPLTTLGQVGGIAHIDDSWGGGIKGERQAEQWVRRSYRLWKQWTSYLVEYSLEPANQLSTDDFAGWLALQTNLALKGILGIKALAGIAHVAGMKADAAEHARIARDYVDKWKGFALSRDQTHVKLAYDWYGSWTTLYNLFNDALLCFHLEGTGIDYQPPSRSGGSSGSGGDEHGPQKPVHPPSPPKDGKDTTGFVDKLVYKLQSDWYYYVRQKYGVPLDSRHMYAKSDWEFFAAAVTGRRTRTAVLESVARWVNETATDRPFSDLYKTEDDGGFPGPNFFARPVVGGHFAFLALERACGGKAMDALRFLDDEAASAADTEKLAKAAAFFTQHGAAPKGLHGDRKAPPQHLEL